jgi:hypothetical protein
MNVKFEGGVVDNEFIVSDLEIKNDFVHIVVDKKQRDAIVNFMKNKRNDFEIKFNKLNMKIMFGYNIGSAAFNNGSLEFMTNFVDYLSFIEDLKNMCAEDFFHFHMEPSYIDGIHVEDIVFEII